MKKHRTTLEEIIWGKIKYWQGINGKSRNDIAKSFKKSVRSIYRIEKTPGTIKLSELDRFLYVNGLTIDELLKM